MIISAYLNILLKAVTRKHYQYMLTLFITIFMGIKMVMPGDLETNNLIAFITIYMTSAYIKLHTNNTKNKGIKHLYISVFLMLSSNAILSNSNSFRSFSEY